MKRKFHFLLTLFFLGGVASTANTAAGAAARPTTAISKPGCQSQCGNVTVPYPFGIGSGSSCSIDPWFNINCNTSFNPPIPFICNLQVYNISSTQVRVSNSVSTPCYNQQGNLIQQYESGIDLSGSTSPYTLSELYKFTLVGCNDLAMIFSDGERNFRGGCVSLSSKPRDLVDESCSGIGCCQTSIPRGLKHYNIMVGSISNRTQIWSFNPCSYAFLGEQETFVFRGASDLADTNFMNMTRENVHIVLDWVVGNLTCSEARRSNVLACQPNTNCVDSNIGYSGYRCICKEGSEGNPYLSPGCQS